MQYSTMVRTREIIGRGMPRALRSRVGEHRKAHVGVRSVRSLDAAQDSWLQTNAGARAQSDFWVRLLVMGNMGRPPL